MRIEGKDLGRTKVPADLTILALHTINRAHLPQLRRIEGLPIEALELRWYSDADLSAVPFPPTLNHLRVWHSGKLRSLAGIERATGLESLELEDNGPLEDASALQALPNLTSLDIRGGFSAKQRVSGFGFLVGLRLDRLTLRGIRGPDLALEPVVQMKTLKELDLFGPDFEPEELARAAAAHPSLYERLLKMPDEADWARCKTCGGPRKALFLRRRKGLWCPSCEAEGLERQLDAFRDLVDAARVGGT